MRIKLTILLCLVSSGAWAAISTPINCALGNPTGTGSSIVSAAMGTVASTCATAASTTTGNHITAYISYQLPSGGSITTGCTDTAGDTFHLVSGTVFDEVVVDMAYADNITAQAGNVVTCSLSAGTASTRFLYVEEVSGIASTSSLDTTAVNGGNGTSLTKPVITSLSGDIICAFAAGISSLGTITAGTGFTKGRAGGQITTEYQVVGSAGTYTTSMSWTNTVNTSFMAASFKSAGGGAVTTHTRHSVRATQ